MAAMTEQRVIRIPEKLRQDALEARGELLMYCRHHNWAGYDPYDALNSQLVQKLPGFDSRISRIALTQVMTRMPVNIRGLLGIPKTQNPKALALFLESFLLSPVEGPHSERDVAQQMIERLIELRSPDVPYWCWGYSFPWQGRAVLVPAGAANLVCTTFVASALVTAYEQLGHQQCLMMALSAGEYILNELYWADNGEAGFSYPLPSLRARIHNANFLAAALISRLAKHTGNKKLLEPALRAARYSARSQRPDGSWSYGALPTQDWIDNFHTGFNLSALRSIGLTLDTNEFENNMKRGLDFYKARFFRDDGAPRYFHNRTFPIDIHCVAQSIITLMEFRHLEPDNVELAASVLRWALKHMRDEQGYFYYRVLPLGKIRTSYMRWSQAWMMLALSAFLHECDASLRHPHSPLEMSRTSD